MWDEVEDSAGPPGPPGPPGVLDADGNPLRGVAAMRDMSERFGLHLMHDPAPAIPAVLTAIVVRSAARRPDADGWHFERLGLVPAQGALDFTAAERLLFAAPHEVTIDAVGPVVVDLADVTWADAASTAMLHACPCRELIRAGQRWREAQRDLCVYQWHDDRLRCCAWCS